VAAERFAICVSRSVAQAIYLAICLMDMNRVMIQKLENPRQRDSSL
jgi:hypothetical protein